MKRYNFGMLKFIGCILFCKAISALDNITLDQAIKHSNPKQVRELRHKNLLSNVDKKRYFDLACDILKYRQKTLINNQKHGSGLARIITGVSDKERLYAVSGIGAIVYTLFCIHPHHLIWRFNGVLSGVVLIIAAKIHKTKRLEKEYNNALDIKFLLYNENEYAFQ